MFYDSLRNNPLNSFCSVSEAVMSCMKPYLSLLKEGRTVSGTGATFNNKTINMEYASRLLWGVLSHLVGNNSDDAGEFQYLIDSVIAGADPDNCDFWGDPGDFDQILVEMPAIALAIILKPKIFWEPLSSDKQDRIAKWLSLINKREIPECNWLLFPLLVNAALLKVRPEMADRKLMRECITRTEEFYVKSGWYNDGDREERRSRDYYVPWAFYLLGLIFITVCPDFDKGYTRRLKERAVIFAKEFRTWFAPDGSALPYGRSLTYRYAQGAFWGALVFAGIEALPLGEIKGLWARNMRWWFKQDFFSETGIQQTGYTYPNMYMSERYNSPASHLWSLQAFLPLMVGEDHPFWSAEELPLVQDEHVIIQEPTGFFVHNIKGDDHVYVVSNGQSTPGISNEHNHMAEKYEKFAYSNSFGFNVSTDLLGIDKLAPDNMLLIGQDKDYYRCKRDSYNHFISESYSSSSWEPFSDVKITTYQIPVKNWIIRFHHIICVTDIFTVEGGFPVPYDHRDFSQSMEHNNNDRNGFYIGTFFGGSGIYDYNLNRESMGVNCSPNSNIQHPNTYVPILESFLSRGEHLLVTGILAHPDREFSSSAWQDKPDILKVSLCLPEEILSLLAKDYRLKRFQNEKMNK